MVQLDNVLKCYKTQLPPYRLDSVTREDEFAKELLELWKGRNLKGKTYTAYLYTEPVGFILLQEGDGECTIRGTWVSENFRKKKVGEFLLKNVLADHKKENIWVNITEGAEGFYTKYGFTICGKRTDTPEPMSVGIYSNISVDLKIKKFKEKYALQPR